MESHKHLTSTLRITSTLSILSAQLSQNPHFQTLLSISWLLLMIAVTAVGVLAHTALLTWFSTE